MRLKWYWILLILVVFSGAVIAAAHFAGRQKVDTKVETSVFMVEDKFFKQTGLTAPEEITKDEFITAGGKC